MIDAEVRLFLPRIQRQIRDYEIFMAQVMAMGHDKRGNQTYKRNEDGL